MCTSTPWPVGVIGLLTTSRVHTSRLKKVLWGVWSSVTFQKNLQALLKQNTSAYTIRSIYTKIQKNCVSSSLRRCLCLSKWFSSWKYMKMQLFFCVFASSGESRYLGSPETAPTRIAKHQYYDLGTDVPGAGFQLKRRFGRKRKTLIFVCPRKQRYYKGEKYGWGEKKNDDVFLYLILWLPWLLVSVSYEHVQI